MNIQGEKGSPVTGTVDVDVRVCTDEVNGSVVYEEHMDTVPVQNGIYSFRWGRDGQDESGSPCDMTTICRQHSELWMEMWINGERMRPRHRIVAVPFALRAHTARCALDARHAARAGSAVHAAYAAHAHRADSLAPGAVVPGPAVPGPVIATTSAYTHAMTDWR